MQNLKKLRTLDIRDNAYLRDLTVAEDMKNLRDLYLPGLGEEFKLHKLVADLCGREGCPWTPLIQKKNCLKHISILWVDTTKISPKK